MPDDVKPATDEEVATIRSGVRLLRLHFDYAQVGGLLARLDAAEAERDRLRDGLTRLLGAESGIIALARAALEDRPGADQANL